METQKPLFKDEDGEEVDVHIYRSMIGSLMYLTSSRPDIMFAVCACVRYQVNQKVSHLHAVKKIFMYLKGERIPKKDKIGSKPDKNGKRGEAGKSQKQLQNPPPAYVKAVEEICVTCGGAPPYYQCLAKIKKMNDVSLKAMQNQIDMVKNELRNEMKTSIQTSFSNQTNEIKNMMASLLQMNTASTSVSGSLLGNTVANPKGELKAITTRSGLVTDGPTVPNPPKSINPEEDECVKETYIDPDLAEYTIKKKLGLPDLVSTRMTLELANRAICTPDGITRDVFVPVGKFTFPADYIVVDYESDPRVSLMLGSPFLRTACALIDIHDEEMILRDGDERLTLNMKHDTASYSNHRHRDSIASPEVTHEIHDSKGCNFLSEELPDIDSFNDIHSHFDDDPLSCSTTYSANSLLEEFTDELSLITYPLDYDDNRTFDSKGEKIKEAELLIDQLDLPCDILSEYDSFNSQDFSRDDDLPSPDNEDKVKEYQKRTKSNPNWTKTGSVAKPFSQTCGILSSIFQGFFEDIKTHDPPFREKLTFNFSNECIQAFRILKEKLTGAPILIASNWDQPFELMCDASDYAVGAVLGQRVEKHFWPIHYASKTMNQAETNYTTTENEMLAVVYAFEKFCSYLIMNKSIVYTDHSALKYSFAKKDVKARLRHWILLLQEFDFKVIDTKGAKNYAADHLLRLENPYENVFDPKEINETFPLESLNKITH
nr:reverse transcriptase domain-containing protein [Tanacetum cinerariifolium]